MAILELDSDEAVIMQATGVIADSKSSVDLVLTNKNIIQINKGLFGNEKSYDIFPLSELKLFEGKANVLIGKNRNGSKRLEIYLSFCELYYTFKSTHELKQWLNTITKVHKSLLAELDEKNKKSVSLLIDSVKGKIGKIIPGKEAQKKICKCPKCGAELTGIKGELVTCNYCENAIVIK